MIGYLEGRPLSLWGNTLTLLCSGGVGYDIELPARLVEGLSVLPPSFSLFVHTHTSEDATRLFGFDSKESRAFFRLLLKISGVGPKVALSVLSLGSLEEVLNALYRKDLTTLTKAKGLGKKGAERILIELQDKIKDIAALQPQSLSGAQPSPPEAEMALLALGYRPAEAKDRLARALKTLGQEAHTAELIKEALKPM